MVKNNNLIASFRLLSTKNNFFLGLLYCLDFILLGLVLFMFINHVYFIINRLLDYFNNGFANIDTICYMANTNPEGGRVTLGSETQTTIIHSNEGWAQGIKSIFIYGAGALRFQLLRGGGTPLLVLSTTITADAISTGLKNAINDPEYVEKHISS